ncbi:polysaccharide deacetylase family protein [uncultured Cytophaga sp.]|uniref:polysaccharide deacetylase family protein n=1 Tax=uncultured Cytophaga sp. TaxID=160238 RepID=UPI00260E3B6B|nr:polysaccharide deacetylase family protein [uncultured Cytophaga sp.]
MILFIVLSVIFVLVCMFHNQGVPIWLFHQVNDTTSNTKSETLDAFFSFLSEKKYHTHTLKEIDILFKAGKKLPGKSVVLTFDDGYYDNYGIVFPLLKKYNLKAIFFVNTLFIKEKAERPLVQIQHSDALNAQLISNYFKGQDATSSQYISWEEINEMEASGLVDIQCHSHRHGMVFSNTDFKNSVSSNGVSSGDYFVLDGDPEEGFPLFKMRGELTAQGYKIDREGKVLFKEYALKNNLQELSKKKRIELGKQFFTETFIGTHIQKYTELQFEDRVKREMNENKSQIEAHIPNKKAIGFAWPYGHQSQISIPWMKSLGIQYFFTCKKGTNARSFKKEFIYRMELRKVTSARLIFLTKLNSNFALGWMYRWLS